MLTVGRLDGRGRAVSSIWASLFELCGHFAPEPRSRSELPAQTCVPTNSVIAMQTLNRSTVSHQGRCDLQFTSGRQEIAAESHSRLKLSAYTRARPSIVGAWRTLNASAVSHLRSKLRSAVDFGGVKNSTIVTLPFGAAGPHTCPNEPGTALETATEYSLLQHIFGRI